MNNKISEIYVFLHFKAQRKNKQMLQGWKGMGALQMPDNAYSIQGDKGHSPSSSKICLPAATAVPGVPLPLSLCPPSSITILHTRQNRRKTQHLGFHPSTEALLTPGNIFCAPVRWKRLFFCQINNDAVLLWSIWWLLQFLAAQKCVWIFWLTGEVRAAGASMCSNTISWGFTGIIIICYFIWFTCKEPCKI